MAACAQVHLDVPIATIEEVINDPKEKGVLLIDVREPKELQETGTLPLSINIPLGDLEAALSKLSPEDFKEKYGRDKPSKSDPMIFSCRSGARASRATAKALELGFEKAKSYRGSWLEWESQMK